MMIADTDVLVDALQGREPARGRIDLELATGRLATTAVTAFELLSGVRSSAQLDKIQKLLGALTILPFGFEAAEKAAAVRRQLESEGEGIGMADYLIAGVCLTQRALLITRNRRHFERVPGLGLATLTPGD